MCTHDHSIVDTMRRRVIELDNGTIVRDQRTGSTPEPWLRLDYVTREVGHNLVRNVTHPGVVITVFVSLSLVGMAFVVHGVQNAAAVGRRRRVHRLPEPRRRPGRDRRHR